jgi:hypothetical protein
MQNFYYEQIFLPGLYSITHKNNVPNGTNQIAMARK